MLHSLKQYDCGIIVVVKYHYVSHIYNIYLYDLNLKQILKTIGKYDNSTQPLYCYIKINKHNNHILKCGTTKYNKSRLSLDEHCYMNHVLAVKQMNISNKIIYNDKVIVRYEHNTLLMILLAEYVLYLLPSELRNEIKNILYKSPYISLII